MPKKRDAIPLRIVCSASLAKAQTRRFCCDPERLLLSSPGHNVPAVVEWQPYRNSAGSEPWMSSASNAGLQPSLPLT